MDINILLALQNLRNSANVIQIMTRAEEQRGSVIRKDGRFSFQQKGKKAFLQQKQADASICGKNVYNTVRLLCRGSLLRTGV